MLSASLAGAVLLLSGWCMADPSHVVPNYAVSPTLPNLSLGDEEGKVLATSLAMGGASTVALAAHGAFLELASRRRARLERHCGDLCPDYRIDEYKEARRMAALSLSVGMMAAASSVWLMYNDPDQLLQLTHPVKPVRHPGLTLRLKPKKNGVWAMMVARF